MPCNIKFIPTLCNPFNDLEMKKTPFPSVSLFSLSIAGGGRANGCNRGRNVTMRSSRCLARAGGKPALSVLLLAALLLSALLLAAPLCFRALVA